MKRTTSTMTTHGEIPHVEYNGILCPVKITMTKARQLAVTKDGIPEPKVDGRRYVHALPGGGYILGELKGDAA